MYDDIALVMWSITNDYVALYLSSGDISII